MKRASLFATLVVLCVSTVAAISVPKPTAEITKFQVEAISLRDVTFLFELTVKNPYPVGLSFSGMNMDFLVENAKVFSAANKGGFKVPAKGTKGNTFTVTLAYEDIIKVVKGYTSKEWLDTVIQGKLSIPLPQTIPGLPKEVSFSYNLEKKIPAIKPQVSVVGFEVKPPSAEQIAGAAKKAGKKVNPETARGVFSDLFKGKRPKKELFDPATLDVPLTVSFTIEVKNEAAAPLGFTALDYQLSVNGESLVAGKSTKVVRRGSSTLVTVESVFSSRKLSDNVRSLFDTRSGTFEVRGSASLKLPDEIRVEPIPLSFKEGGTFKIQ